MRGIQTILKGIFWGRIGMTAGAVGHEHAFFMDNFLSNFLTAIFHFKTKDGAQTSGKK